MWRAARLTGSERIWYALLHGAVREAVYASRKESTDLISLNFSSASGEEFLSGWYCANKRQHEHAVEAAEAAGIFGDGVGERTRTYLDRLLVPLLVAIEVAERETLGPVPLM